MKKDADTGELRSVDAERNTLGSCGMDATKVVLWFPCLEWLFCCASGLRECNLVFPERSWRNGGKQVGFTAREVEEIKRLYLEEGRSHAQIAKIVDVE